MTERKIIRLGKNNYNMNEIKNILSSSKKINKLISEKKKSLKNTDYLNNYDFKKNVKSKKTVASISPQKKVSNYKQNNINTSNLNTLKINQTNNIVPDVNHKPNIKLNPSTNNITTKETNKNNLVNNKVKSNVPETYKPKSILKKNKKILSKSKKPQFKTKSVNSYFKPKPKKTKKYNKYEIKYIIHSLKELVEKNNYKKINQLLKKLRREQLIQLLSHYKVIKYNSRAPTPLLKNLIFNFILGNIHIEKK